MPVYSGAVLAPWPNRIGDGRYRYGDREYQLPINEPDRDTALHGLVADVTWRPVSWSPSRVRLEYGLSPTPGYPFALRLTMDYQLTAEGLGMRLAVENVGDVAAPYGCSIHPYLVGGAGPVDDWRLELPATRYLDVDPQRLLPVGERAVDGTPFDFRAARRIADLRIDHAFCGIAWSPQDRARAVITGADGTGVRIDWDHTCPWVQIHTADRPEPALDRTGLAVEPMTCPPDAFRTGRDLIRLRPGDTHEVRWHLAAADHGRSSHGV
jgi:aldose 1-epimerase